MYFNQNLAQYFADQGIISKDKVNEILERTKVNGTRFDIEGVKTGMLTEEIAVKYLSEFLNIPFLELNILSLDANIVKDVPISYIKDNRVVPVNISDNFITVAIDNPNSFQEALNIRYYYKTVVKIVMITSNQMDNAITYLDNKSKKTQVLHDLKTDKNHLVDEIEDDLKIVNAPVVQLADSILKEAMSSLASDIHIEPFEKEVRIRFRIDGALVESNALTKVVYQSVLARYKIMANMNIAERRIPQDGKIRMDINGVDYDFRVSTIPTIHGEKIVIRIYDNSAKNLGFSFLGIMKDQEEILREIISKPYGIVLVTGPTGSGKSTTLYTFLKELNKGAVNITTVEDPVENVIEGVNQIQVNPKAQLTFSAALRSILRQDPNIIMIGEIRDEETAQMAIRAAITGHLVLATLHTNDSIGTLDRLVDMGVPDYLVVDAMTGAIAQRLVRKLCPYCKKEHKTNATEMKVLGIKKPINIFEPQGCEHCNFTGYRGRTAVFEILNVDDNIRDLLVKERFSSEQLKKSLKDSGMLFLEDSCRAYVIDGITSIDEYNTTI